MKKSKSILQVCCLTFFALAVWSCGKVQPESQESLLDAMPEKTEVYSIDEFSGKMTSNSSMMMLLWMLEQQGIGFDGKQIIPSEGEIEGDAGNLMVCSTKMQYITKGPSGEDIKVSGRITFPFYPGKVRNIILCPMPTTIQNDMAPSVLGYSMPADMLALLGYMVVSPDYIGYGDSRAVRHPYVHNNLTAQTCVDMLDGVKSELSWYWKFRKKGMPKEIYIMGYSQGGAAALSCARRIEEKRSREYTILKTYAGDGPYSLSATMDYYRRTNTVSMASVIPYVVLGLEYGDKLDLDLRNIFNPELFNNYQAWYFGKDKGPGEIDALITHNGEYTHLTDFLSDDFVKEGFGGNADMQSVYNACLANDNIDWTPRSPLVLYHSEDDDVVPFVNARSAYDSFISRGANPDKIKLVTVSGSTYTHGYTVFPFCKFIAKELQ